jgi:hypothetical protein
MRKRIALSTALIYIQVYRDNKQFAIVDVDHPPLSPVRPPLLSVVPLPHARPTISGGETPAKELSEVWSSPAFLRHPRVSSGAFFNPLYDPFADDDGYILGTGRKRTKISQVEDSGKDAEEPRHSRAANGASQPPPSLEQLDVPSTISTMEDAQTQTTITIPDDSQESYGEDVEMTIAAEMRQVDKMVPEPRQEVASSADAISVDTSRPSEGPALTLETSMEKEALSIPITAPELLDRPSQPPIQPVEVIESSSEEEEEEKEEEEETPDRMPTPRLEPLHSPGLPLVSPLIKRTGPQGSYFPSPSENRSELDASGKTTTAEYPSLPPPEPPSEPLVDAMSLSPVQLQEEVTEGVRAIDAVEDVDGESEESYVEEQPGTVEFEPVRSDIPYGPGPVTESDEEEFEEDEEDYEDDELDKDEEMVDAEPASSEFEGFSTPGGVLGGDQEGDQKEIDDEEPQAEAETGNMIEHEDLPGGEKDEIDAKNMHEPGPKSKEAYSKAQDLKGRAEGAEAEEEPADDGEPEAGVDDHEQREENILEDDESEEEYSEDEYPEIERTEAEEYDEEEESETEESQRQAAQRLQVPRSEEIIDLTEDSEEEAPEIQIEEAAVPSTKEEMDEKPAGTDQEMIEREDPDEENEDGEPDEELSKNRSSCSVSVGEDTIRERQDIPASPAMDEPAVGEDHEMEDQHEEEQSSPLADPDGVSYPELPDADAEVAGEVKRPGSVAVVTQGPTEMSDAMVDPRLSNQLMTPTATATASQLTSLLSRQSTAMQDDDHLLPTPQDTQATVEATVSKATLQTDGVVETLDEPKEISPGKHLSSMGVPKAMSAWFEAKRSSQAQVNESESEASRDEEAEVEEDVSEDQGDSEEREKSILPGSPPDQYLPATVSTGHKGLTTPHSYFSPLSTMSTNFSKNIDIIAVSTSDCPKAERAKSGPKDYFTTLTLTDPSSLSSAQHVVVAQIFRPHDTAIPTVSRGDIVLLRAFKVQTQKRKFMLLSTEESAWVVFKQGVGELGEVMSGPPVEFDGMERAYVKGLWRWWEQEGEEGLKKVEATSSPRMTTRSMGKSIFTAINGGS